MESLSNRSRKPVGFPTVRKFRYNLFCPYLSRLQRYKPRHRVRGNPYYKRYHGRPTMTKLGRFSYGKADIGNVWKIWNPRWIETVLWRASLLNELRTNRNCYLRKLLYQGVRKSFPFFFVAFFVRSRYSDFFYLFIYQIKKLQK